MHPILFNLGPISINTVNVFLVLAFLLSGYVFWKRGRDEHYKEEIIFDGFLLSLIVGLISARVGFVLLNLDTFGFSFLKWIDIFAHPGLSGIVGLFAMGIYIYRFSRKNKWDGFEILDFWVSAMSLGLAVLHLGMFFDLNSYGIVTNLPIGVKFPGSFEARHPLQLYYAGFYLLLFVYLQWAEFQYRTFEWYRFGKKTAQTGFLLAMAMITSGIVMIAFSFLKEAPDVLFGVNLEIIVGFLSFIFGIILLYVRSGRELPFFKKRQHGKIERL